MKAASKKKLWKIISTLIFIAFNAGVIIATAVSEFGNSDSAIELMSVDLNGWLLIPATLCFMGMITLEYWKYALMMMKSTKPGAFTKREAWHTAFKTVMLGRYYDRITPAAVGGQPAQMLTLHRTGKVSDGLAAAMPIYSMIAGQTTFLLIAIPFILFSGLAFSHPALFVTAQIGFLFYAFWPVMVAGTTFFPKATAKFINFCVKILAGLKIVKNKKEAIKQVEEKVNDYAKGIKVITKNPLVSGGVMVMSLISNILITMVPFFVLLAFGGDIDFMECFVLSLGVQAAIYFIPTPGNSGAAEGTFYVVFSRLSSGYVFWAMMLWRVFSYYIYIIVGPLIYLHSYIKKRKKHDHA